MGIYTLSHPPQALTPPHFQVSQIDKGKALSISVKAVIILMGVDYRLAR